MLHTLQLHEYTLPVKEGFSFQSPTRKGIILENPEHGIYAEASPLPSYSKESTTEALMQLSSVLQSLLNISSEEELFMFFRSHTLYPSVKCCIYILFLQIFSPITLPFSIPVRHYIDIPYKGSFSCNLMLEKISSLYKKPSQTFKIKLGSYPVDVAIDLMRFIIKTYHISIQLDINQKWSLEEICLFCKSFEKEAFHSIEDPTKNVTDLIALTKHYPHPISLDNLLRCYNLKSFLTIPSIKICELKPMLDMHSILDPVFMTFLNDYGIEYTFSSSYETSIGIAGIGLLGKKHSLSSHLGIDTLDIFSHDILTSSFYTTSNQMVIEKPLCINNRYSSLHATTNLSYR